MDTKNSLPQEVKHPRARRTRRPLGLADTRPQVHIYVDTPDGISDGDGRMSTLDLTSTGLNFIADYSDGSYVILDVKFVTPIVVPATSQLWIAAQNLLREIWDEDADIPSVDKASEALRAALAGTPPQATVSLPLDPLVARIRSLCQQAYSYALNETGPGMFEIRELIGEACDVLNETAGGDS